MCELSNLDYYCSHLASVFFSFGRKPVSVFWGDPLYNTFRMLAKNFYVGEIIITWIPGYENKYSINKNAVITSYLKTPSKTLKHNITNNGYCLVGLCNNGTQKKPQCT